MFQPHASNRAIANIIVKYTRASSADLRQLANIASIAAEIKHEQETGKVSPAPAPTDG